MAAGAGFSLALACDLRVASSDARFLLAYANIGCTADGGSTYMLPRIVGQGRAMEIYLARQPIGAQYALELGLVSQVFESSHFERHAMETADLLSQGPTRAYGRVKALFDGSWDSDLATQLDAETDAIANIGPDAGLPGGDTRLLAEAAGVVPGGVVRKSRWGSPGCP